MRGKKLTPEIFIEKANKIHNNKYDYSLVKILPSLSARDKIVPKCPIHGAFREPQLVSNHLAGRGCPLCGPSAPITLEDAKNIAKKFGGELLSEGVDVASTNALTWKCANGHIFDKIYSEIKNKGTWCNLCSLPWKSEEICRIYFETIFEKKFIKCRPNWLVNETGFRLELDGFCDELKLAFEHNGEQHITYQSVFSKSRLEYIQSNDNTKLEICKNNGINLIIIPQLYSRTPIKKLEKIVKDLAISYGIELKENYFYDFSLLSKSKYAENKLKTIQEFAESKGGKCLSIAYLTSKAHYDFMCEIGHKWSATPAQLFYNEYWCDQCKNIENTLNLIPFSKEEIQKLFVESNKVVLQLTRKLNDDYHIKINKGTVARILNILNIRK
jgi:hypothetical protein